MPHKCCVATTVLCDIWSIALAYSGSRSTRFVRNALARTSHIPVDRARLTALAQLLRPVRFAQTKANNFDSSKLGDARYGDGIQQTKQALPDVEFIVQRNDETQRLWEPLQKIGAR